MQDVKHEISKKGNFTKNDLISLSREFARWALPASALFFLNRLGGYDFGEYNTVLAFVIPLAIKALEKYSKESIYVKS